eukprot:11199608-Lingulodinium_polyedra.AAC.1
MVRATRPRLGNGANAATARATWLWHGGGANGTQWRGQRQRFKRRVLGTGGPKLSYRCGNVNTYP